MIIVFLQYLQLDRSHEKAHMIRGRPQNQPKAAPELLAGATQAMSIEKRDRAVINARIFAARYVPCVFTLKTRSSVVYHNRGM